MRIPKRINILGHPVSVYHRARPLDLGDDEKATGLAHIFTNQIGICTKVDGDYIAESLKTEAFLHEICHHIDHKLGLRMDEEQVQGVALGLLQVIRDNRLNFLDTEDVMGKKGKGKKKGAAPVVGKGKKCK